MQTFITTPKESLATPLEQGAEAALDVVQRHHPRIANTIRSLWGKPECSMYINKLILSGMDDTGHARIGFHQDAAAAMLALTDLHDTEFGSPSR